MKNVSYYRHLHPESLKKLVAITKITAAKKNQGNFEHHKKNRIQEKKG